MNVTRWNITNDSAEELDWTGEELEEDGTVGEVVATGLTLGLIIIFTLLGNCLVVLAVVLFRRLRSVTNYFIVSLAVADLTVAVLVMPYSVLYQIEGRWRFGWTFCHFWISCDVTCCTASILHLCLISIDRYLAITEPLTYRTRMPKRRAILLIIGVWSCSGAISFVPIYLGWFYDPRRRSMVTNAEATSCLLHPNWKYAVVSSCTSFYLPLVVMAAVYARIFQIAKRQAEEIDFLEKSFRQTNPQRVSARLSKRSMRVRRESKAIKTLGTLMGLFCVCWIPFFVMYLVTPFCGEGCPIDMEVEAAVTWLGYCNSFINPCVYAFLNKDFRNAFKKILLCDCNRSSRRCLTSGSFQHPETYVSTDTLASSSSRNALLQHSTTRTETGKGLFFGGRVKQSVSSLAPDIRLRILNCHVKTVVVSVSDNKTTADTNNL